MTTPSVGGEKKKKKDEEAKISLEDLEKVSEVIFFDGPKAAEKLNIEGAEDVVNLISKSTYRTSEAHKPKVVRGFNKVSQSTFGTIGKAALAVGGAALLATKGVKAAKKYNKKRKAKKVGTPIADELLSAE